jgi:hypothetical protein
MRELLTQRSYFAGRVVSLYNGTEAAAKEYCVTVSRTKIRIALI